MTISRRLYVLMRQRGIRGQSQLAERAAVAQSTVHRILNVPNYTPTRRTIIRLAKALDATPVWLSDGIVAVEPPPASRAQAEDEPPHPPSHASACPPEAPTKSR